MKYLFNARFCIAAHFFRPRHTHGVVVCEAKRVCDVRAPSSVDDCLCQPENVLAILLL